MRSRRDPGKRRVLGVQQPVRLGIRDYTDAPSGTLRSMAEQKPPAAYRPPEITYIGCAQCGTQIAGLDGRYACPGCGWVNDWSEGHTPLADN